MTSRWRLVFVVIALAVVSIGATQLHDQASFDAEKQSAPPHVMRGDRASDSFGVERTPYVTPFDMEVRAEADAIAAYLAAIEATRIAEEQAERERLEEQARIEAQRRAVRPVSPSPGGGSAAVADGDVWWQLALCECGGNPGCNTGNGFYGTFQFLLSTWQSVGGEGYPYEHSYEEQLHRAQILQERAGWGQWPGCASKLGLR